jgi:hypothetical protein
MVIANYMQRTTMPSLDLTASKASLASACMYDSPSYRNPINFYEMAHLCCFSSNFLTGREICAMCMDIGPRLIFGVREYHAAELITNSDLATGMT